MGYKLPKELTEAEWKKHKAALATDTGISGKLRTLKGVADDYDDTDDKNKALVAALKVFSKEAADAAKDLSGAFAKTKAFLQTMSKVANAAVHTVHKEMTDRWEDERNKEKQAKLKAEHEAREALEAALGKDFDTYMKALAKEGRVLGVVVGTTIKFKQAMEKDAFGEAQGVLKEKGVDVKLGDLVKLSKTMPKKDDK